MRLDKQLRVIPPNPAIHPYSSNVNEQLSFDLGDKLPWAKNLAVFDLETTGLDLREARIVTACAVEIDEQGQVVGPNIESVSYTHLTLPTIYSV